MKENRNKRTFVKKNTIYQLFIAIELQIWYKIDAKTYFLVVQHEHDLIQIFMNIN